MTDRELAEAHLINAALDVYRDGPAFGYKFITDELNDLACELVRTGFGSCAAANGPGPCLRRNAD